MRSAFATLMMVFALVLPAQAERPRPLGWAMDAMRAGNWDNAALIAQRDGPVAADVIEWHRLRAGGGTYTEVMNFLARRPDWPGEAYLRKRSEDAVIREGDEAILKFFKAQPPQTPRGVLAHAGALIRADRLGEAQVRLVLAWRTMPMDNTSQALFLADYGDLLNPHHAARLDEMLWQRDHNDAQRMFDLVSDADKALAQVRMALQKREGDVNAMIDALPASKASDPGLQADRFEWRIRKGFQDSAKELILSQSVSATALGQPSAWSNRRRALARDEMRNGDPERAYEIASKHFLESGSDFADLEWLSGYLALRFLKKPKLALTHFQKHDDAVESPISQGRAGYWQGRALEAMGDADGAAKAYAQGAKFQSSFYGLLAAERGNVPFDLELAGEPPKQDWRTSPLSQAPLFQAGMLLQASGELDTAERFWTHLAGQLVADDALLLGQAAIDVGRPHLAVMIGKRVAQRGITIAAPYYPLHSAIKLDLNMSPEMVLAIARRESEFDPGVQSSVGARGLMQLMPGTAQDVAKGLGVITQHATDRLIADPDYNALLGSEYLSQMSGRFDGNVVMVSAAYNAGPSRPAGWMQTYGDPRKGDIDIVDWIEMIPFRETQNYVMRVTESLPVYRARLGKDPLPQLFSEELTGSTLLPFAPKRK